MTCEILSFFCSNRKLLLCGPAHVEKAKVEILALKGKAKHKHSVWTCSSGSYWLDQARGVINGASFFPVPCWSGNQIPGEGNLSLHDQCMRMAPTAPIPLFIIFSLFLSLLNITVHGIVECVHTCIRASICHKSDVEPCKASTNIDGYLFLIKDSSFFKDILTYIHWAMS